MIVEYDKMSFSEKNNKITSIKNWLKNGVSKILKPLIKSYLGDRLSKFIKSIELDVSDDSYDISTANGNHYIKVSLSEEEACTLEKSDLMRVLKFKLYHELSHVLYSSELNPDTGKEYYEEAISRIADIFTEIASCQNKFFISNHLKSLCSDVMNCIEDGRIENILCTTYVGAKKHRDWYRLTLWKKNKVKNESPKIGDLRNAILTIATIGMLPNGFNVKYPNSGNFFNFVLGLSGCIGQYVCSNSIKSAFPVIDELSYKIAPYYVDAYALSEEDYEHYKSTQKNRKYSDEELNKIAQRVAEEMQNMKASPIPSADIPSTNNGPIVSVLTDDEIKGEEISLETTPDVIVDLRKNPVFSDKEGDSLDKEDNPYYYRPEGIDSNKNNDGSGDLSLDNEKQMESKTDTSLSKEENMADDGLSQSSESNSLNKSSEEDNNGYILPDSSFLESLISSSLQNRIEESCAEVKSDIQRANKEQSEWEINQHDSFPLDKQTISVLAQEFGGYEDVDIVDYRKKSGVRQVKCPSDILLKSKRLAQKLQTIIYNKSSRDRYGCYNGLVNSQDLGKFLTGQPDYYKQEGIKKKTDFSCLILKDDSGSMCGDNEHKALEVLAELEEAFKIIDFPLRMQAFSTKHGETMKIIKSWNDKNKNVSYTYSFGSTSKPDWGNNDAYSISLATDILAQRKEKNKLLIIVSDGAPCCSTELVKKAVERARGKGIFVISILIGTENEVTSNWNTFTQMYGHNLLAGSLDKMGDQLFKFVKKFISLI